MTSKNSIAPDAVAAHVVSAFTDGGAGGNLAGVVLDAGEIDRPERQRIAALLGFSETAFVEDLPGRVYAVEFYTPTEQVPDCGHATIATFHLIAARDGDGAMTKRTIIGDRAMRVDRGLVVMEQPRPAFVPLDEAETAAAALGLDVTAVGTPVLADNGVRFVLVPVADAHTLRGIVPRLDAIERHSVAVDAYGYYVYAPGSGAHAATVRMFAPRIGIAEEPATGMAAGMLGAFLGGDEVRVQQGALSPQPSPSELVVHPRADGVAVGGRAVTRETREIERA